MNRRVAYTAARSMSDADLITEASASRIAMVRELANRFDVAVEENTRLRRGLQRLLEGAEPSDNDTQADEQGIPK